MLSFLFLLVGVFHAHIVGMQNGLDATKYSAAVCFAIIAIYLHNKSNLIGSIHAFSNNTMAKLSERLIGLIFGPLLLQLVITLLWVCCKLLILGRSHLSSPGAVTALLYIPTLIFTLFLLNATIGDVHFSYQTAKGFMFL